MIRLLFPSSLFPSRVFMESFLKTHGFRERWVFHSSAADRGFSEEGGCGELNMKPYLEIGHNRTIRKREIPKILEPL